MFRRNAHYLSLTACCLAALWARPGFSVHAAQRGGITASHNLPDLVDESAVILRGSVISARVEPHPNFPALWTVLITLRVDETLKGQAAGTYTFRQYIWDSRDRSDAAGYTKSGPLLLFLLRPNSAGLSSPAGLEQGRFRLTSDSSGNLYATNGRNNAGLFNGVASRVTAKGLRLSLRSEALIAAPPPSGAVALEDLRDLVKQFAGAN